MVVGVNEVVKCLISTRYVESVYANSADVVCVSSAAVCSDTDVIMCVEMALVTCMHAGQS